MIEQITSIATKIHSLGISPDVRNGTTTLKLGDGLAYGLVGLAAGIAMLGATGSGAGQGIAAGRAAEAVGRNPQAESKIRNMMIIGDGVAASASIYALIIALLLIFVF